MDGLSHIQSIVTFAWWIALDLSVLLYILLDGADLGAGVFSLFVRDHHERGAIMSAMAGTWDANETWLIVAGGVLFGTFPFVYGSAFSYLMVPLALALWGMITRALSLEFRHLAETPWQRFSDVCFGVSSLVVAFFGGMAVGAILQGFPLTNTPGTVPTYVGGALRFISPFSIWTGIAAVLAVALSGVLFIRARFEHGEPIREQAARWTGTIFYLALAAVAITVVINAVIFPWAANKWFGSHFWVWGLVLLAVVFVAFKMREASRQDRDVAAILWFNLAVAIMAVAMMVTVYPWIVPGTWTIYAGASPAVSLVTFTLAMGGFFPVMLMYNAYQIWVFRARITALAAYH
ncbi:MULTISPECIES: cytochrome d ubiquinol oxidase subunit II [Acetobacter]|uniref:Cytochrome D ubiquinol oxidase subunit II n=1 Tax=Acetobacter musti TaxID=864732 RepID=A0ABX0JTP6_9PROT|nr:MULTISPECIES: cytochrome d ubiquinol oxidase subunit II [Acetobacter]MBV1838738.1 cytochrome d ubiquinol oxidase subunit II [Acetobacter estunensis]NHN86717.1 cytochrome D ubiquinol oxidase subunit II [Acetobacter musti]